MRCILLGCAIYFLTGCGPMQANSAISEGKSALDIARTTGAEELAPYPFHLAEAYLTMAKTKRGFSEFEIAKEYGNRARANAEKATENSRKRRNLHEMLKARDAEDNQW